MRILIDTNIVIPRENNWIVPTPVGDLMRTIAERRDGVLVHPASIAELSKHKDRSRRDVTLSKVAAYEVLSNPPDPAMDSQFGSILPHPNTPNDQVDDALLYAVVRDSVDVLISNDTGVQRKAGLLGVQNRVFGVTEAVKFLQDLATKVDSVLAPQPVARVPLHSLSIEDPFFDSLKNEYAGFENWFRRLSRSGEHAWVYKNADGFVGAFMLLKDENEPIELSDSALPKKRRVKIRTLKVTSNGYRLGELYLKIAIEFAIQNGIDELYVTVYPDGKDHLLSMLAPIGFELKGYREDGEAVYTKRLVAPARVHDPRTLRTTYYPSFSASSSVSSFIVPIVPKYHQRLFQAWQSEQLTLLFPEDQLLPEGNAITKAYLCNSKTRKVSPNSILLFYRSKDYKAVTSVGTVETVYGPETLPSERVIGLAGKRIVYSDDEIAEITSRPALLLLFRWHFHFAQPVGIDYICKASILKRAPQSITEIAIDGAWSILREGSIDDRFVINKA